MAEVCDYIGISPCNDYSDKVKDEWLYHCFHILNKIGKIDKVKTHAFGMTSAALLKKYPWFSADSSSYAFTSAFGTVFTPYGKVVISSEQPDHQDHIDKKPIEIRQKLIDHIESYGFSYKLAQKNYKYRNIVNIDYYQELENEINANPVVFKEDQATLFPIDY